MDELAKLQDTVKQLKRDLGHKRNDGYTVVAVREAIDKAIAEAELDFDAIKESYLPGCEPPELVRLRRLREVAYGDHCSDMFQKSGK
jgi:hypothetical protein